MQKDFQIWAVLGSQFIGDYFDQAQLVLNERLQSLDPLVQFLVQQLYLDCHLSSESVLILAANGKEWDADLIIRSILEGSLKFVYLLDGNSTEQVVRANEYWNVLPDFGAIRRDSRARSMIPDLPNAENERWEPVRDLLMDEDEINTVRQNYSRKERAALEERWSFSGITREFANSDKPGLKNLAHLSHSYGLSSHLLHKDGDGIGVIWERSTRCPERREAAAAAHISRIVSDTCVFTQLRTHLLFRALDESTDSIKAIETRYRESLFQNLNEAQKSFLRIEYP